VCSAPRPPRAVRSHRAAPLRTVAVLKQDACGLPSIARSVRTALLICIMAAACSSPVSRPIQVHRNLLTVDNQTSRDWLDVEIWINQQYRLTVSRIAARSRFTATLDVFVAGFGQRFDVKRQRIDDLRLKARERDGTPVDVRFEPPKAGLAGALDGFGS
jgi:hypothetical protein